MYSLYIVLLRYSVTPLHCSVKIQCKTVLFVFVSLCRKLPDFSTQSTKITTGYTIFAVRLDNHCFWPLVVCLAHILLLTFLFMTESMYICRYIYMCMQYIYKSCIMYVYHYRQTDTTIINRVMSQENWVRPDLFP